MCLWGLVQHYSHFWGRQCVCADSFQLVQCSFFNPSHGPGFHLSSTCLFVCGWSGWLQVTWELWRCLTVLHVVWSSHYFGKDRIHRLYLFFAFLAQVDFVWSSFWAIYCVGRFYGFFLILIYKHCPGSACTFHPIATPCKSLRWECLCGASGGANGVRISWSAAMHIDLLARLSTAPGILCRHSPNEPQLLQLFGIKSGTNRNIFMQGIYT